MAELCYLMYAHSDYSRVFYELILIGPVFMIVFTEHFSVGQWVASFCRMVIYIESEE